MRSTFSRIFFALCLIVQVAGPAGQNPNRPERPSDHLRQQLAVFDTSTDEPITVIVELTEQAAAVTGRHSAERETRLNRIRAERGNVFSHLRRLGIAVSPRHEFELAYNGF